jgi:hypothetical protein
MQPTDPRLVTRYRHDADELRRLADWLSIGIEEVPVSPSEAALDYYKLASRLSDLAEMALEFADTQSGPVP